MENTAIKVLLVDDDQGDFEMFRVMLSKAENQAYEIDWVSTYEEAMDAFKAGSYDVYFLDYNLEDRTGLDLLKKARDMGVTAPIIMLTGRGSRTVDMAAMDMGASDYLVKGLIDPDALERAIRHGMERAEGAQAIKEREERLTGFAAANPTNAGTPGAGAVLEPTSETGIDARRFSAVFQASRSGIALVDLDGMLLKVNPAFAGMFSPTPRWSEGMSYLDLLDESDREAVGMEFQTLARGERGKFESARRFMIREGDIQWGHTTAILIRDEAGSPDHMVVIVENVGKAS